MDPFRFDEFTKTLATSSTRRAALRRIGGILGGTAFAGVFPGLAFAKNSACAQFCASVFGADTPAAAQCTSDAAHGKGLCHSCGSNADISSICCTRNASGFCASYSPTLPCSCAANQTCQNGTCVTPCAANGGTCSVDTDCCSGNCSNGICCGSGKVGLSNGTCATPCTSMCCQGCEQDTSGATYCRGDACNNTSCYTDSDCPMGQFCNSACAHIPPFAGSCTPAC